MTFYECLTAAINDFIQYGFDSPRRLEYWVGELKKSVVKSLITEKQMQKELERSLRSAFDRLVTKGGLVNKDVSRFTVDRLKPKMREELDRRIMASLNMIQYNRQETISNMLRRFSGWATSIPAGGTEVAKKMEEKKHIKQELSTISFKERRVIIDQTHKLVANIKDIVAMDNGAIAGMWHSNWEQEGYNYREKHKELDGKIFLIKDSWAVKDGYVKPKDGYTSDVVAPAEEVYCRCRYKYLYRVSQLPEDMVTQKGKLALQSKQIY